MVACFALLCVIWGTTWAVIQIGLAGIPPLSGVAIRFVIAAALLLVLAFARRVPMGRTPRERWLWLSNGIFAFSISYGVVYWAEQWVPSGLTSVLFATYPLFVSLLARFLLPDEAGGGGELLGTLLGFAGVAVIFSTDFELLGGRQVLIASAVLLLSPLAAAFSSVFVKRWGAGIHPFSLTAVPMALTGALMGGLAFAFERQRTFTWDVVSVGALLYLAVFGSAVTFTLYYWLLSYWPAKRMALIAYVIPLIAVGIGALRGEPLTAPVLGGSGMVIAGVALAIHRQARRR